MKLIVPYAFTLALVACGQDAVPAGGDDAPPPSGEPVYYGQVQKIFNANCVECHSDDPARLAPFSLANYTDAAQAAQDFPMAYDVMNRIMPPFYAEQDGDCGTFPNAHWLSADDQAAISAWANGSRLEGDVALAEAPPPPPGGLSNPNFTMDLPSFTPSTAQTDDFECYVVDAIDPNGTTDKFVTGAHVHPGNLTVAHHAIVFTLDAAAEADVVANHPGPGPYRCDGGPTQVGNANFLIGWIPGQQATIFPEGTGIKLDTTRKLVVQMHYNTVNSDGLPDHTTVDLQLVDSVSLPAQMIRISAPVNLAPHSPDATAVGSLKIPNAVSTARLWGTTTHMHTRGTGATLVNKTNNNQCLIDLEGWSFHWQHFYWNAQPQVLHGGDTLELTCHYDTTGDSNNVQFCETTECEMCIEFGYVTQ